MSNDPIARAARALRETHDGTSAAAAETRRSVLAAAVTRGRRRHTVLVVVVPLAAVLALSTAWAAVTGRLQRWVARPGTIATATSTATPTPTSTPTPTPTPTPAATPTATPTPTPTATPRLPPSPDPEEPLYAAAHRMHFVTRDPAAALRAWDAYLAAYPNGRFALEARYNRALTLARLGRTDEARDALTPFANGQLGGYRQKEARELIGVLDGGP